MLSDAFNKYKENKTEDLTLLCASLIDEAMKTSKDNITCMIVKFHKEKENKKH
jgi:hypothetical protein